MADVSIPLAAVIGHPVGHSLSPNLFSALAAAEGRQLSYGKIDVAPSDLDRWFAQLSGDGTFVGWNVTLPHKERMLALADQASEVAKAVGAANVLHFEKGRAVAHNTDAFGIEATLNEQACDIRNKDVVLYGAGGAARAAAYVFGKVGAGRVLVVNRTIERAKRLCADFQSQFPRTKFEAMGYEVPKATPQCLVNATSLGLHGETKSFPFPVRSAPKALAFDLLYGSESTPFLRQAKARGLRTVNGLDMLLWQAIGTWKIWFGPVSDPSAVKARIAAELRRKETP